MLVVSCPAHTLICCSGGRIPSVLPGVKMPCVWPSTRSIVFVVVVVLAVWIGSERQAILDEVHLLVECHGDPTHQARQLTDLRKKYDKREKEHARLTDEMNTCQQDKDTELSHMKSSEINSYWKGFSHAAVLVTVISVLLFISLLYLLHKINAYFIRRSENDRERRESERRAEIELHHRQRLADLAYVNQQRQLQDNPQRQQGTWWSRMLSN